MLANMTDATNISRQAVTQLGHSPSSFKTASEARIRAGAIQQPISQEEQTGLARLNKTMAAGRPMRSDVPRGYYLNIRV